LYRQRHGWDAVESASAPAFLPGSFERRGLLASVGDTTLQIAKRNGKDACLALLSEMHKAVPAASPPTLGAIATAATRSEATAREALRAAELRAAESRERQRNDENRARAQGLRAVEIDDAFQRGLATGHMGTPGQGSTLDDDMWMVFVDRRHHYEECAQVLRDLLVGVMPPAEAVAGGDNAMLAPGAMCGVAVVSTNSGTVSCIAGTLAGGDGGGSDGDGNSSCSSSSSGDDGDDDDD